MNRLAVIFSFSIIFLFSCSSTPKNDPLADMVGENKIGYVQTSCMQNPDNIQGWFQDKTSMNTSTEMIT